MTEVAIGIPGGEMASREVHFIWLLDCSGSMSINGKIAQLNFAIKEAIPEMCRVAGENATAQLMVRALTFASGAKWHIGKPTAVEDFTWSDVSTWGATDLGAALKLVANELTTPPMPSRSMRPVLALVSDGQPTDDWRSGLRAVDGTPWGKKAIRVAVAIGDDADTAMLQEFIGNPEQQVFRADNPKQLVAAIRWISTVGVKVASAPQRQDTTTPAPFMPPPVTDDDTAIW